jgi:hypothetical protein
VHVVATLRPLGKILPSAWQQYVKDGYTGDYESWLTGMLLEPPYEQPTPWFWIRHSHDVVLARWAAVVGPANVTAVIVDPRDHDFLFRQFESLLDLPAGALVREAKPRNTSLSWPEAELLRQVNVALRAHSCSEAAYGRYIRGGLTPRVMAARSADAAVESIITPRWAMERAAEVGAAAAKAIDALGIRVLGDLDSLGRPPAPGEPEPVAGEPRVDPATLAAAVSGVLRAAAAASTSAGSAPKESTSLWRRLRGAQRREISPLPEF